MTAIDSDIPHRPDTRYDAVTIGFHWLTALLVAALFIMTLVWRSRDLKPQLESLHISLGILLAAVLIARLIWRLTAGRRLGGTGTPIIDIASKIVHGLLYLLLVVQVGLGFGLRWFQGEPFSFFGLFPIPSLFAANRPFAHQLEDLHNLAAWTLIYLVAAHAAAALLHRYFAKDDVMKRMLPVSR